ncbi:MAG TPA: hypothetical protein VFG76_07950 [Candidatus Polarisedimenticolia bacterium]|nr:hypothetical protein [Candidatus Polarisedimenticolia bacterium]
MSLPAQYVIVEDDLLNEEPLVIKDVGPWDRHLTITNDAESVVKRLASDGHLPAGRRLFYIDSEGEKDELVVQDGRFVRFGPGGRP